MEKLLYDFILKKIKGKKVGKKREYYSSDLLVGGRSG
jgi:hypothetical protein